MAYAIAAYHDLGIPKGRKTHHLTSAALMQADKTLLRWFSEEQITLMKEAIEDHRASADNPPRTLYGQIIADADHYIVPEDILRRTILYGKTNYPHPSHSEHIERARDHMREKFCENGYLHFHLGHPRSLEGLQALRDLVSDENRFNAICKKYL